MDFEPMSTQLNVCKKFGVIILLVRLEEKLDLDRTFGEIARVAPQRNASELCLSAHRLRTNLRAVKLVEHLDKRIAVCTSGAVSDAAAIGHEGYVLAEWAALPIRA